MSGMTFEQQDFTDTLMAGIGKSEISITASVLLDKYALLPNGQIKPCWCVSFLLMGDGFSISKILQIGTSKSCEKEAKRISDSINRFNNNYRIMKEALPICLPDSVSDCQLEDYQKFVISKSKEIVEG